MPIAANENALCNGITFMPTFVNIMNRQERSQIVDSFIGVLSFLKRGIQAQK